MLENKESTDQTPVATVPKKNAPRLRKSLEKYGLAIAPAIAYFLCYTYESAYCGVWNLPRQFIEIGIPTILFFCSVIIGLGLTIPMLFDSLLTAKKAESESGGYRVFLLYTPVIFLLLLIATVTKFELWDFLLWSSIIFVGIICDISLAFFFRKEKPYLHRLDGPLQFLVAPGSFLGIAKNRAGNHFSVVVIIYIFYVVSLLYGRSTAKHETWFLVPSSNPKSVVVRKYGDKIICSEVDLDRKTRTNRFFIITEGADPALTFEWKEIGKLNDPSEPNKAKDGKEATKLTGASEPHKATDDTKVTSPAKDPTTVPLVPSQSP